MSAVKLWMFGSITHECWAELPLVRTAQMEANGSLAGHLRAYSTNADSHIHDCFYYFCQLTYKYIFWMQPAECKDTHIHTQTIRAVAGRHSALHPVVSLHASKLFSVTQILIWKSQLTELTKTREEGSKDPLSSFFCPFSFSLSAPFDWYLLMPAAAHPYFMSVSHLRQWTLKMVIGCWHLFHRGIETSPVIWALDF